MDNLCSLINRRSQSVHVFWVHLCDILERAIQWRQWACHQLAQLGGGERTEYTEHSSYGTIGLLFMIGGVDVWGYTYVNALEKLWALGKNEATNKMSLKNLRVSENSEKMEGGLDLVQWHITCLERPRPSIASFIN